jgi:hypothetical protein
MATLQKAVWFQTAKEELDNHTLEICAELQLSLRRYRLAGQRYGAVNQLLEREGRPFRSFRPRIFPQGSMALETTCKPVEGPHDLDFVLQLDAPYWQWPALAALNALYEFLSGNETYGKIISMKNRVVRLAFVCGYLPSRDAFSQIAGTIRRSA